MSWVHKVRPSQACSALCEPERRNPHISFAQFVVKQRGLLERAGMRLPLNFIEFQCPGCARSVPHPIGAYDLDFGFIQRHSPSPTNGRWCVWRDARTLVVPLGGRKRRPENREPAGVWAG
jgi:hypothetical protein